MQHRTDEDAPWAPVDSLAYRQRPRPWFSIAVTVVCWAVLLLLFLATLFVSTAGYRVEVGYWVLVYTAPILYVLNAFALFFARSWWVRFPHLVLPSLGYPSLLCPGSSFFSSSKPQ